MHSRQRTKLLNSAHDPTNPGPLCKRSRRYAERTQEVECKPKQMDLMEKEVNLATLVESCKPKKKRGRPSHKRQLQEIRNERRVNLQTADSVVTTTNLKLLLNIEALKTLPRHCQNQLIRLLPSFDQIRQDDGTMGVRATALSNEYFARFCTQYLEKLSDNKLSEKALEQAKSDASRDLAKLDPWKLKNYEPIWGKKLISQQLDESGEDEMLDRVLRHVSKRKTHSRPPSNRRKKLIKAR